MGLKDIIKTHFPSSNTVLFESAPDISDNTAAVYYEMLRRGLNKQYTFVWQLFDGKKPEDLPKHSNVVYINMAGNSKIEKAKFDYYRLSAKCIITCNRWKGSANNRQSSFYLSHGTPLKDTSAYYTIPHDVNYMICASEGSKYLYIHSNKPGPKTKVEGLGLPRNDTLVNERKDLNRIFGTEFEKIITWYPTFRQNKNSGQGSNEVSALPLINNEKAGSDFNAFLKKRNVLFVLKPHPAQNMNFIKKHNFSNIWIVDEAYLSEYNLTSYQFLTGTDALITDYSSIYFDYLLLDRPIGVILSDYDDYKKVSALPDDYENLIRGGEKIYTYDDLCNFVIHIKEGKDLLKLQRNAENDEMNAPGAGEYTQRITDFIIDKAGL